jgi:hypothetical protein
LWWPSFSEPFFLLIFAQFDGGIAEILGGNPGVVQWGVPFPTYQVLRATLTIPFVAYQLFHLVLFAGACACVSGRIVRSPNLIGDCRYWRRCSTLNMFVPGYLSLISSLYTLLNWKGSCSSLHQLGVFAFGLDPFKRVGIDHH